MEPLHFKTKEDFKQWLIENYRTSEGVWLLFGKNNELLTVKANEALEVALCYGWIDGVMKKVDDISYVKYFSMRRKNSKWSAKNKQLIQKLEKEGLVSSFGKSKIEEAKQNGQWDNADNVFEIAQKQILIVEGLLKENKQALENFQAMSPSIRKTYTRAYLDAKTEAGRKKRLEWLIERLEKNLKPM